MINPYLRKDHQGEWVDKMPDIWATTLYEGALVAITKRYGSEADLGLVLCDREKFRNEEQILEVLRKFVIESVPERLVGLAKKLGIEANSVPDNKKPREVFFEYDIRKNGLIYVCRVTSTRSKPVELKKVLAELKKR